MYQSAVTEVVDASLRRLCATGAKCYADRSNLRLVEPSF